MANARAGFRAALRRTLTRRTSGGRFIAEIDGVRFIALMPVLLYHLTESYLTRTGRDGASDPLVAVLMQGPVGVALFFLLSGFIIALPFAERIRRGETRLAVRAYFLRRLIRLEPPYILSLFVWFALLVLARDRSAAELAPHLAASMVYGHGLVYGTQSVVNAVAWSLEVEFQFYVLAPLLATVFRLRSTALRRAILLGATVLMALVSLVTLGSPRMRLSLLGHAHFFLAGLLFADVYVYRWSQRPSLARRWDLVGAGCVALIGAVGIALIDSPYLPYTRALLPLPLFFLCCAAFRGPIINRFLRNPAVYVIGGMCYTVYLYHWAVIVAVAPLALRLLRPDWPVWAQLLVMIAVVIPAILAVSAVIFVTTERPFMGRSWPVRRRPAPAIDGVATAPERA